MNGRSASVLLVLILCLTASAAVPSDRSEADSAELLGVSYESHSPSGFYQLDVEYYSDGVLSLKVVDSTTKQEASESFRAVSVSVHKLPGIDGDAHSSDSPIGHLYPLEMGSSQKVEGVVSDLEEGYYHVIIRNVGGDEVVCSKFVIGEVIDLEFRASEGGTVSEGSIVGQSLTYKVPKGSIVEMDGQTITVRYQSKVLHAVVATPPQGMFLDGWFVDGSKLSSGSSLDADTVVTAQWTSKDPDAPDDGDDDGDDGKGPGSITWAEIPVTTIRVPEGWSSLVPYSVHPASTRIGWTTSDGSKVTVEDGVIRAVSGGTVTISLVGSMGQVLATVKVVVEPASKDIVDKEIEYSDAGKVTVHYDKDEDAIERLVNPIEIEPGVNKRVSVEQSATVRGYIDVLRQNGIEPSVIVTTGYTEVAVPANLLESLAEAGGSLAIREGDVTLSYPNAVLEEIGWSDDIKLVIVPERVDEVDDAIVIDDPVLAMHPDVYEVYMLRNGQRIFQEGSPASSPIGVTIDYSLEDWQTVGKLHVYYLEPDPDDEIGFRYSDGGIHFELVTTQDPPLD